MSLVVWLVITSLILVNALYVAAEFAAVSARRSRILNLAEDGHPLATRLLPYVTEPVKLDRLVAACQIGITLSSLILGAYSQATLAKEIAPLFARWGSMQQVAAESSATIAVLIIITVLQVVVGELVPKSVALTYPTQVALYTIYPMKWSLTLLSGVINVLNGSGGLILKWLGVSNQGHRHIHSPEEITLLLEESKQVGLLDPVEHRRLQKALTLSKQPISELMIPLEQVEAISLDAPRDEILRQVANSPYTRLPVYQGSPSNIRGLIHTKDLTIEMITSGDSLQIKSLVRPLPRVAEATTAEELLAGFRERHFHMAAVTNPVGKVVGLVTLEDVLAEVMGDVGDEFKEAYPEPEFLPDGRIRIPGALTLDEIRDFVGEAWPAGATTVAAHLVGIFGRSPAEGESLEVGSLRLTLERVEQGQILSIVLEPQAILAGEEVSTWRF